MVRKCKYKGCRRIHQARGWCNLHYKRWFRHGDPNIVLQASSPGIGKYTKLDKPSYRGMHKRVESVRGKAKDHVCIDCGKPADEWSYNGNDPNELTETRTRRDKPETFAYSLDPSHYDPRCKSCHNIFDKYKNYA